MEAAGGPFAAFQIPKSFRGSFETDNLSIKHITTYTEIELAYKLTLIPDVHAGMEFPEPFSLEAFRRGLQTFPVRHVYLVRVRGKKEPAGLFVLWSLPEPQGWWQILYGIRPEFRGRGFAQEAVRAFLARLEAVPSVRGVLARVKAGNAASQAVLRHQGMAVVSTPAGVEFRTRFQRSGVP